MNGPEDFDPGRPPQDVIDAWAKDCRCCPDCEVPPPCDGCSAGGVCDHSGCTCDDESEIDDDDGGTP